MNVDKIDAVIELLQELKVNQRKLAILASVDGIRVTFGVDEDTQHMQFDTDKIMQSRSFNSYDLRALASTLSVVLNTRIAEIVIRLRNLGVTVSGD
jgi:lipopolysaccharide assembly outer membrane protein LptD (OstA)